MLPLGMWLGVGGYTLIFYGSRLWSGDPVTLAEAVGLSTTDPQRASSTSSGGSSFWGSLIPFVGRFPL